MLNAKIAMSLFLIEMDDDITDWTPELHDFVREKSMVFEPEYIVFEPLEDNQRVTYVYVQNTHMPSELPIDYEWEYQPAIIFWPDDLQLATSILGTLDRVKDAYMIVIKDVIGHCS
jgi:hypothetical protein